MVCPLCGCVTQLYFKSLTDVGSAAMRARLLQGASYNPKETPERRDVDGLKTSAY